jgi:hypothetical protein
VCWLIRVRGRGTRRGIALHTQDLRGKSWMSFDEGGSLLLCVPNRQICLIAASTISKITSIFLTSSGQQLRCCAGQAIKHEALVQIVPAEQPPCARLTVGHIAGLSQRGCLVPNSGYGPWKRTTLLTRSDDRAFCHQSIDECDYL